ncbi:serine/threonine protein kinase [Mastigocladus laminosus UU774]|nr:serine/threonine protein kinase [Mastigocladus laminosus UU774]
MFNTTEIHCINPDCQRPYPQRWESKFCHCCGAPLQLIDRYIPMRRLGAGGFAQIYTVWDQKTQTQRVLKVLVEDSPKARELFAQEASVLSSLRHPGVPKVESDGYFQRIWVHGKGQQTLPCLVMEKINGQTLEEVLCKQYPQGCPQDLVLNWLSQAVEILRHLHQRNIIHRDIKPSNLMLRTLSKSPFDHKKGREANQLVLIDFGGAKQFAATNVVSQPRSTKLFSSGYSPPEQVMGGHVEPNADFYALGRTMVELLTGKHPVDLEDPLTGELHWRSQCRVHPQLADLLDEMMQEEARSRPENTAVIQRRLAQIDQAPPNPVGTNKTNRTNRTNSRNVTLTLVLTNTRLSPILGFFSDLRKQIQNSVVNFAQAIGQIILFVLGAIAKVIRACLDTIWTMILTSIGAAGGTFSGYVLANHTEWGKQVGESLSSQLSVLLGNNQSVLGSEILLFAGAGLGTAWGIVTAGGYRQRRRFLAASLMGIFGYGFGWFILQLITPKEDGEGLIALILAAVSLLTLGLGLRSHHIVHAVVTAFGTALPFAFLLYVGLPPTIFNDFFSPTNNWHELLWKIGFFGLLGILISFWLGVSHYLFVPGLRLLGWRD